MEITRKYIWHARFKALIRLAKWLSRQGYNINTYPGLEAYDRRVLILKQLENLGLVEDDRLPVYV